MDQAVVGATVQVVLQNLLSVPIDEIKLVLGMEKDLSKLHKSLLMIQDFLGDAEVKQANNRAVKRWLEQLEDVAFEADAVLDECQSELLRQKVKKQNRPPNKVMSFLSPGVSYSLGFRRKMAHKIEEVNNNLDTINKEATSFGLQMIAMVNTSTQHAGCVGFVKPPTVSLSVESHIVGREKDESEIVEMLLSAPQGETCSVIPILGMGGIGKTTIARSVFHHVRVGAHFEKRIWVCVSVKFDATLLFKMILESLSRENVQSIMTIEVVLEKIREHLTSKRYLLVLDDVWNENYKEWDDFVCALAGISSMKGNCVIVTTRRGNVGSLVGTLPTHQVHSLSNDDCWSIIRSKAFLRDDRVPLEFEEIGKSIAQRCGGLPLAANVVGGLLRGKSYDEWNSILRDKLLDFAHDYDTVIKILKLSYDHLPSPQHKKCFAYCSILPQDYKIQRVRLIELWMAEGFVQADRGKDMETVGEEIFNFLLQNSLLHDAHRGDYGSITYCRMHDLVHDVACSVSGSSTVRVENGRSGCLLHQARYLAINSFKEESYAMLKQQAKCLRSLCFEGKIVDGMFVSMKRLHVLKLIGESIHELPNVFGELIQLRFLAISDTCVKYLPASIGELCNLQTLLISYDGRQYLKNLPNTMVDLISLRHLYVSDDVELPPWMGKLASLQTLPHYKVGHGQGCGIRELGYLKNLKGLLKIRNLEMVKDEEEAKQADLLGKSNIFGLVFEWGLLERGDEINDKNVLEGLQPHPSLKSLDIIGYSGINFPPWTMKMAAHNDMGVCGEVLKHLIQIKLESCRQFEELPMFGHLPHLRLLVLRDLPNVRCIGHSFYGLENCSTLPEPRTAAAFPALERLEVSGMPELTEWVDIEGGITVFPGLKCLEIKQCPKLMNSLPSRFPCLERLTIESCPKLRSNPSHFPCLEELEVKEVEADFSLAHVCSSTSSLKSVKIESASVYLPHELLDMNHSLKKLHIEDCRNLVQLPNDLNAALEELCITGCPELKSIQYARGESLRELTISNCSGLTDLSSELLESCSSSIQKLTLGSLDSLENLGDAIPYLSRMTSLQHLHLVGIPKLLIFPITEVGCVRSLNSLAIGGFSDSISCLSFNQHLDMLLKENHSLEYLFLQGNEHLDTLSDEIQHLSSLRLLSFCSFGFETFPEWIGNFRCLERLWVINCKRLRNLPSEEAMLRLTKLERLNIRGCPLIAPDE